MGGGSSPKEDTKLTEPIKSFIIKKYLGPAVITIFWTERKTNGTPCP